MCLCECVLPGCGQGFPQDGRQSIKLCWASLQVGVKKLVCVSGLNLTKKKNLRFKTRIHTNTVSVCSHKYTYEKQRKYSGWGGEEGGNKTR